MQRLGRYQLGRLLGRGGAGEVYEAQLQGPGELRRPVALKILHKGNDALRREARIGGLLRHRHLVDVYEINDVDGQWFCAMELCAGGSLSQHIPLPPRAVVEVGLQVCAALQYAHEELGLIHLDLKPANLLLSEAQGKMIFCGLKRSPDRWLRQGMPMGTGAMMTPAEGPPPSRGRRGACIDVLIRRSVIPLMGAAYVS